MTVGEVIDRFIVNLGAAMADPSVWLAIGLSLIAMAFVFGLGYVLARGVDLLDPVGQESEILGVSLAVGLLATCVLWAAVASGARSAFTPAALAIGAAGIAAFRSTRPLHAVLAWTRSRRAVGIRFPLGATTTLGAGALLIVFALTYASTMTPSPRGGIQPLEYTDEAYYALLGAELARSGTESIVSTSAVETPGMPLQTWYHWGEMWLAAAVISTTGLDPIPARHLVVLPIILLTVALLTGSLTRRINHTRSRAALLFAIACACVLAPIPMPAGIFAYWARGNIFGVTMYGLGLVIVLLVVVDVVLRKPERTSARLLLSCAAIASLIPAHVILAGLAAVGAFGSFAVAWLMKIPWREALSAVRPDAGRLIRGTAALATATVVWGILTGHQIGASNPHPSVPPFIDAWRDGVLAATLASGLFLAIPVVVWIQRRSRGPIFWLAVATLVILVFGAVAWGARFGDYTMFHVFFGGIAAFATPMAAVAVVAVARHFRQMGAPRRRLILTTLVILQMEISAFTALLRLEEFGPSGNEQIPVSVLNRIRTLPPSAKLAYACRPRTELGYWQAELIAIYAHTGRRVLPTCYQAEVLIWAAPADVPSLAFLASPLGHIFPTGGSTPRSEEVRKFLLSQGIDYIYADARHPNTLVADAIPVVVDGDFQLLEIPR
jgi:hypothetical protein